MHKLDLSRKYDIAPMQQTLQRKADAIPGHLVDSCTTATVAPKHAPGITIAFNRDYSLATHEKNSSVARNDRSALTQIPADSTQIGADLPFAQFVQLRS